MPVLKPAPKPAVKRPPVLIAPHGIALVKKPAGPVRKILVRGTPSIGLGQAIHYTGADGGAPAAGFIGGNQDAANAGDPTAQANASVLSLAQAINTSADFVAKWFGAAAAATIRAGAHIATGP